MRTTLDIDESLLTAIKEVARREGRTAGAVASELIRRGLTPRQDQRVAEAAARYGFRPFPSEGDGPVVTNDDINRLRDDLNI
jgi:hypothetical protein